MKRSWLIVALLLSVGINLGIVTVIGLSRIRGPRQWEGRLEESFGPRFARMADRLGLEGEQRQGFQAQQREFFEAMRELRMKLEIARRQLQGEVVAQEPDRERIDALLRQSAELTAALERLFVDNVMMSRELLDRRQERLYFGFLDRLRRGDERRPGPGRRP